MALELVIAKVATIERCVLRAREEYLAAGADFATDFTRQDAAAINILRACEASLKLCHLAIRLAHLGSPTGHREAVDCLVQAHWIDAALAESLKAMIAYRNIALHDYQSILAPITQSILESHLDQLLVFARGMLTRLAHKP
jgi:uncharacterized protein YutE (UPF0331/DUF86 family)